MPSSYAPGPRFDDAVLEARLAARVSVPIWMLTILVFVRLSARSGEYAPGPMVVSNFFSTRLYPMVNVLVSCPKSLPSSYYPGPTPVLSSLFKERRVGEVPIFILVVFTLVMASPLSMS